jgi:tryptophan 2,3-dioxygenase
MAKTVFDVLVDRIDEQISSAKDFLAAGSPKDYSEVREVVGLIRGLESSKSYIEDLAQNYMDNDDD